MKTTPERMAQKLVQTETQIQTQTLSSLQVALAGLIELPAGDLADRIRDELKAQGIEITDVPGGAKWKRV